tara:strand:- start:1437 stop:2129 length:693 start_codon:yes stop_codon:yes gene_type:complete
MNINDKSALESAFAENFASPYFPILANLYLDEGDLSRAKKVCEVGLDHDSTNIDGKFILAKVAMAEDKFTLAEKWLKQVVEANPTHFTALRALIKLEIQLHRSSKTIEIYISRLLQFLPYDTECINWLQEINSFDAIDTNTTSDDELENETDIESTPEDIVEKPLIKTEEKSYEVVESMATFTMVQVLKSQKHYSQALSVLDVLKEKGRDAERIAKEKSEIQQLLEVSLQ